MQVGGRVEGEQRVGADHVLVGSDVDEVGLVLDGGDAVEFGLERIESLGVGGLFVHAGAVVVADFLVDGAAIRAAGGGFLQNSSQRDEIAFVEFGEADPLGLVGGDFRILEPVAAGVLVEVDARVGGLIDGLDAEAGGHLVVRRLGEGDKGGENDQGAEREAWCLHK